MQSYAAGRTLPLIEKGLHEIFDATVSEGPEREAIVSRHQNLRLTYEELQERAAETAAGLRGLGVGAGDRVGMWAASCAEWIYLQIATSRIGAVLVNVNPAYRANDLRFILEKSRMKVLFLHANDARADYRQILREASEDADLALEHAVLLGSESWDQMIAGGRKLVERPCDPREVVNIQYTSGTTGKPKGVLLTHHNIVNNAYLVGRCLQWTADDILCMPVPLYHCFGCVMGSLQCLVFGAKLVLPAPQFDPLATLRAIHEEKCTTIYGVPTMFIAELNHADFAKYDMSSLRTGIMAGAPCPVELMKRVVGEMHCREMTIAYGQTESSPVITQSSTSDSLEIRVSTVGSVMPCTEVRIADPVTNETVKVGVQGELCTRGYLVMKGYDGDQGQTAKAVDPDGWLHTGDLATMREDGCFRITGRAKDMIIRGGENISPREIEEFLHGHPKIADVYVVGLPDEKLGERVLAWVRLQPGSEASEDEIRDFCRGKIAHFKIPDYIRFVDGFPMTVTGKVQKFIIRQQEIELRGLEKAASVETA
jgi:fatty-acyl-CoA synthase